MKSRFLVLFLSIYTLAAVIYSLPYIHEAKFNRLHEMVLREGYGKKLIFVDKRDVNISEDKAIEIAYWELGRAGEISDKSKINAIVTHLNLDGRDSWIVSFQNAKFRTRDGEQTGMVLSVFVDSSTGDAFGGLSYHPGNFSFLQ